MKKSLAIVLLSIFCFLVTSHGFALDEVSRGEVIEEASRLTGLTKDTLELIYDEAPSLFDNLERITFAVKVVHLFATAQDNDAMLELFDRFVDNLKSVLLPGPLQTFLTAVKVYQTSLEVVRDYVVIPRFEESIYRNYRSMRLIDWKRGDTSEESKSTAFESAVMGWSGYYLVQEKMYQELLKRKGYKADLLGEKLEKRLRSQIDRFWMSSLELRFQREILAQEESAVVTALWQGVASDLTRLQREAERRLVTPSPSPQPENLPSPSPVELTTAPTPIPSPGSETVSEEETRLFSSFRKLLKEYIEAEIARSGGVKSFFAEVGEAVKIASGIYEVSWKIFGYNEAGEKVLVNEDKTQGTPKDFQEAIQYLEGKLRSGISDLSQDMENTDVSQDSGFSTGYQKPQEDEVLSRYRTVLSRYLERKARELENWDRSHGAQNTYSFEILHAGTPVENDRFFVSYRILVRLQSGDVVPVSSFEGAINLGEIEANIRSMLAFLGESNIDESSPEGLDKDLPPPSDITRDDDTIATPPEEPTTPSGDGPEIVSAFRDLYPRYLAWQAEKETVRAREVFGYDDKVYWVEVVDNAREVAPGVFRVHYRNFVRSGGETSCYNETQLDLTVEQLEKLLRDAREEMEE
ncbi:MAG: hypothetical protein HPY68_00095 [Candidatus Atribacteria bacterium]|nr:hypothetical protein [Candidatus Atribacteria bacterium]